MKLVYRLVFSLIVFSAVQAFADFTGVEYLQDNRWFTENGDSIASKSEGPTVPFEDWRGGELRSNYMSDSIDALALRSDGSSGHFYYNRDEIFDVVFRVNQLTEISLSGTLEEAGDGYATLYFSEGLDPLPSSGVLYQLTNQAGGDRTIAYTSTLQPGEYRLYVSTYAGSTGESSATFRADFAAIPEPSAVVLTLLAGSALVVYRRRVS